jgi:hypothetical protein
VGHEDQFRPPTLNGGYRLGEATFAGTRGNGRRAPFRGGYVVKKAGITSWAKRRSDRRLCLKDSVPQANEQMT